ncbi:ABC transporter ATP-binding protein [Rosistilla ulvae]|nr:ABC transporter ATP-binding protein [Rosistilla ulvae]
MSGFVEFSGVGKTYRESHGQTVIVENFDLHIAKGECVSLLGHSGCGKSTILTMAAGLTAITDGGILVDGHGVDGPGPDRRVVFSLPGLLPWMTVFDNVMLSVRQTHPNATSEEREAIVDGFLHPLGLSDVRDHKATELARGIQQRVGIARAVALNPKMLLLDEPFALLDAEDRMTLQDLLLDLHWRHHLTTLMITRDIDEALLISDRVVLMTKGPKATVGKIVDVQFDRPRVRAKIATHPQYAELRRQISAFLEEQERIDAA